VTTLPLVRDTADAGVRRRRVAALRVVLDVCAMPSDRVTILDHPLVHHRLRYLRDEHTANPEFLRLAGELSRFVAYEAFRRAPLVADVVDTPVAKSVPVRIVDEEYLVVPILRAGLGMVPAVQEVVPHSRVCLVGLRRDEATLQPAVYLDGLPERIDGAHVVVCDPMLATGGSLIQVTDMLVARGAGDVTALCLIASVPGVDRFCAAHPAARVVAAALDETLNDVGYIVPGLGDAGDRLFGPPPR
jgi:uracil phosphoribosyltransferase